MAERAIIKFMKSHLIMKMTYIDYDNIEESNIKISKMGNAYNILYKNNYYVSTTLSQLSLSEHSCYHFNGFKCNKQIKYNIKSNLKYHRKLYNGIFEYNIDNKQYLIIAQQNYLYLWDITSIPIQIKCWNHKCKNINSKYIFVKYKNVIYYNVKGINGINVIHHNKEDIIVYKEVLFNKMITGECVYMAIDDNILYICNLDNIPGLTIYHLEAQPLNPTYIEYWRGSDVNHISFFKDGDNKFALITSLNKKVNNENRELYGTDKIMNIPKSAIWLLDISLIKTFETYIPSIKVLAALIVPNPIATICIEEENTMPLTFITVTNKQLILCKIRYDTIYGNDVSNNRVEIQLKNDYQIVNELISYCFPYEIDQDILISKYKRDGYYYITIPFFTRGFITYRYGAVFEEYYKNNTFMYYKNNEKIGSMCSIHNENLNSHIFLDTLNGIFITKFTENNSIFLTKNINKYHIFPIYLSFQFENKEIKKKIYLSLIDYKLNLGLFYNESKLMNASLLDSCLQLKMNEICYNYGYDKEHESIFMTSNIIKFGNSVFDWNFKNCDIISFIKYSKYILTNFSNNIESSIVLNNNEKIVGLLENDNKIIPYDMIEYCILKLEEKMNHIIFNVSSIVSLNYENMVLNNTIIVKDICNKNLIFYEWDSQNVMFITTNLFIINNYDSLIDGTYYAVYTKNYDTLLGYSRLYLLNNEYINRIREIDNRLEKLNGFLLTSFTNTIEDTINHKNIKTKIKYYKHGEFCLRKCFINNLNQDLLHDNIIINKGNMLGISGVPLIYLNNKIIKYIIQKHFCIENDILSTKNFNDITNLPNGFFITQIHKYINPLLIREKQLLKYDIIIRIENNIYNPTHISDIIYAINTPDNMICIGLWRFNGLKLYWEYKEIFVNIVTYEYIQNYF